MCVSDSFGNIHTAPRNEAVMAGLRLILFCQITENCTTIWLYSAPGDNNTTFLYNGFRIAPNLNTRYEIGKSTPKQSHLVINSAASHHGGMYVCEESKTLLSAASHLTVIGERLIM